MFQIKAQNGYEIQVIGSGEKGLCRVTDRHGRVQDGTGHTWESCLAWLHARGVRLLDERRAPGGMDVQCECGEWSGEACQWTGPQSETVIVQYMPEQHRSSHIAAGNRGTYPHNGARRIRVERSCAARMVEHDGDWCEIVG